MLMTDDSTPSRPSGYGLNGLLRSKGRMTHREKEAADRRQPYKILDHNLSLLTIYEGMMRSVAFRAIVGRNTLSNAWPAAAVQATSLFAGLETTSNPQRRSFAALSMAQIKDLRAMSGAPIVDCKKALAEADGDLDQAMDWLRQHGAAKASKKVSGREAEEGLVACSVAEDGRSASLVKVSSETDFAGKSPAFVDFVTHVADATLASGASGSLDSDNVLTLEVGSKSVQTALEEAIVAIRENLGVASAVKLSTEDGMFVSYVHGKVDGGSNAGSAAALVEIAGENVDPAVMAEAGKKLAMHIVAAKPTFLNQESVPSDVVDKEKEILLGQLADSNKPEKVQEQIVQGRLRKFFSEICLVDQEHMVEEGNPKVSKALKDLGLEVRRFEAISV